MKNREYWETAISHMHDYKEIVMDINTYLIDFRIFLANFSFMSIYNILIPNRKPLDQKYKANQTAFFPKKSFLGNNFDIISRYFWWV